MTETEKLVEGGLCTVPEAAGFLGISQGKLYQLMNQGELRFCKIGKNRRLPWAAVKALAAESLVGSSGEK
jgi:excisionase family DNA binding protein